MVVVLSARNTCAPSSDHLKKKHYAISTFSILHEYFSGSPRYQWPVYKFKT